MNPFDAAVPAANPPQSAPVANPFDAATTSASTGAAPAGFDGVKQLWIKAGGDPAAADKMAHVAFSESSFNPKAVHADTRNGKVYQRTHGLWQISDIDGPVSDDPLENARAAVKLYNARGTQPWVSSQGKGDGGGWGQYASNAPAPSTKPAVVAVAPKPKPPAPDRFQPAKDFFRSLNRPIVDAADAAETANPFDGPAVVAPIAAAKPKRSLIDAAEGGALSAAAGGVKNVLHAGEGVLNTLRAPQRGLAGVGQYVEDHPELENGGVLLHPGGALREGAKWALDPKRNDAADKYDRRRLSTADGGFVPTDAQINAHLKGAPATAARWAAQTGSSVLMDPTTIVPAGAILKGAKMIPGATRAVEALSKSKLGQGASSLFNAEHHLGGLTEHGQNVVEGVRNVAKQAAERAKRGDDLVISAARKDLKAGNIPQPVADLVRKYGLPELKGPQTPSKLMHELEEARHAETTQKISENLRKLDLLEGGPQAQTHLFAEHAPEHAAADLFKDPAKAAEARAGVAEHIKPGAAPDNPIAKVIAKTNNQLKGMFLAVPLPHVGNLLNLSYNKYGMATTLRGLQYAAQESTGLRRAHFTRLVDELQKAGADNQYGKIFSEVNDVGGGSVRQVQRFANAAQDKILNPVERGLRASMMEREIAGGKQGVDAARNVHKALGTDAETGLTKTLDKMPLSQFPRFHTQTAIGSGLRTAVDKPGRLTGFEHAFGGPDQKKDGQAHYHLSTPTASSEKMLDNPLSYFLGSSTLGGLAGVDTPFSTAGLLKKAYSEQAKGKRGTSERDYKKAVQAIGGKVLPVSGTGSALAEIARKKRGEMHESGLQDLFSSLAGGYWSKQ